MKTIFWLLVIMLGIVSGYLIFQFVQNRKQQVSQLNPNLTLDSIARYQERLEQLQAAAARLRERATTAGRVERLRLERHIDRLDAEIRDLAVAIEQWRSALTNAGQADMYRRCILLYGRASGICDVLMSDTLATPVK